MAAGLMEKAHLEEAGAHVAAARQADRIMAVDADFAEAAEAGIVLQDR
jgi:hypothetical protein